MVNVNKNKISIPRDKIKKRIIKGTEYYYYNYYYNKRQKTFYGRTRNEVLEKFQNFISNEDEEMVDLRGVKFENLYKSFLNCKKQEVKPTTFSSYIGIYENHILNSRFGRMNIKDINDIHIRDFIDSLDYSYRSKVKVLTHLNSFYSWCIKREYVNKNWAGEVKLKNYEVEDNSNKYITKDLRNKILEDIKGDRKEVCIRMMCIYGCRLGESLAVNRDSLLGNYRININKAVIKYSSNGKSVSKLSTPKNKYSCRVIKVDDYTYELIKSADWKIIDRSTIQTHLHKRYNISCHSLRHSVLTDMVQEGINIEVIKKFCGHSQSSNTLLLTYTHLQQSFIDDELDKYFK